MTFTLPMVADEDEGPAENEASGIYLWEMASNLVFADRYASGLFGFSEEEGRNGLLLDRFLQRIHPDDVEHTTNAIMNTMGTGESYHTEYRVCRPDSTIVPLVVLGHCFRSPEGVPLHCAGLMFAKPEAESQSLSATQLCLLAYDAARIEGNEEAAEKIIDALSALESAAANKKCAQFMQMRN
jgi:PAS domain-containing protein